MVKKNDQHPTGTVSPWIIWTFNDLSVLARQYAVGKETVAKETGNDNINYQKKPFHEKGLFITLNLPLT